MWRLRIGGGLTAGALLLATVPLGAAATDVRAHFHQVPVTLSGALLLTHHQVTAGMPTSRMYLHLVSTPGDCAQMREQVRMPDYALHPAGFQIALPLASSPAATTASARTPILYLSPVRGWGMEMESPPRPRVSVSASAMDLAGDTTGTLVAPRWRKGSRSFFDARGTFRAPYCGDIHRGNPARPHSLGATQLALTGVAQVVRAVRGSTPPPSAQALVARLVTVRGVVPGPTWRLRANAAPAPGVISVRVRGRRVRLASRADEGGVMAITLGSSGVIARSPAAVWP